VQRGQRSKAEGGGTARAGVPTRSAGVEDQGRVETIKPSHQVDQNVVAACQTRGVELPRRIPRASLGRSHPPTVAPRLSATAALRAAWIAGCELFTPVGSAPKAVTSIWVQ
jgi:hypothetical protein